MFARISLALTMLLGSAWAALAQNYVSQMTPRIRYCGFRAHRIECCQPVRRATSEQDEQFRTSTRANVVAALRFRQRLTQLEQICASKAINLTNR
jgi:predicted membrane metal-binding protein